MSIRKKWGNVYALAHSKATAALHLHAYALIYVRMYVRAQCIACEGVLRVCVSNHPVALLFSNGLVADVRVHMYMVLEKA